MFWHKLILDGQLVYWMVAVIHKVDDVSCYVLTFRCALFFALVICFSSSESSARPLVSYSSTTFQQVSEESASRISFWLWLRMPRPSVILVVASYVCIFGLCSSCKDIWTSFKLLVHLVLTLNCSPLPLCVIMYKLEFNCTILDIWTSFDYRSILAGNCHAYSTIALPMATKCWPAMLLVYPLP